jgi:hypothetical protein
MNLNAFPSFELMTLDLQERKSRAVALEADEPASVCLLSDADTYGIVGQDFLYQFGPLDEAECTAIEVVLIAHVVDLLQLLDAVEVEVEDFRGES